jgi:hypothetical protein
MCAPTLAHRVPALRVTQGKFVADRLRPGAGYSGTPLPAKLGLKAGHRLRVVGAPSNLRELLFDAPPDVVWLPARTAQFDVALVFATTAAELARELARLAPQLGDTGIIWLAWPKKAAGLATELSEGVVRGAGLATGLVDVKVCAINATWSGLKFVRRLADRKGKGAKRR